MEIRAPKSPEEWEEYYDLRYRILREPLGQPRGSERNDADLTGIHFALFEEDRILAIARLDSNEDAFTMQVRFVAVEENQQGKGLGKAIMLATHEAAKQLGMNRIMLHARENAVEFYYSLGYTMLEKSHNLFGLVQHYKMEKEL